MLRSERLFLILTKAGFTSKSDDVMDIISDSEMTNFTPPNNRVLILREVDPEAVIMECVTVTLRNGATLQVTPANVNYLISKEVPVTKFVSTFPAIVSGTLRHCRKIS